MSRAATAPMGTRPDVVAAPRRRRWAAAAMIVALLGGAIGAVAVVIRDDARFCKDAEDKPGCGTSKWQCGDEARHV